MPDAQQPLAQRDEAHRLTLGILGPVEAILGGRPIALGGAKQRALLAVLLLHPNETVSSDRLVEELWGAAPPPTAPKMLQVLVSRLRRVLEPDAPAFESVVTRPPGYALLVEPGEVDLQRFEARVADARFLAPDQPGRAADTLREALATWRGAPLSDVAGEPFARWAIPRLEELRLATLAERVDLDLRAGRHAALVGELRDLVARHPYQERLVGQLMLALYRSGRQKEALDVYGLARAQLDSDLGIEPGADLERLQVAILRQDPELEASSPAVDGVAGRRAEDPVDSQDPHVASRGASPTAATASAKRPRLGRRSRAATARMLGVATGLALIVGVLTIALTAASRPSEGSGTGLPEATAVIAAPNSVAVFDPAADQLAADIPVGAAPAAIAADEGSVWVANTDDRTVLRIDIATHRVLRTTGLSAAPVGLTVSGGSVWIGNGFSGTMSRILVAYDQLSAPFFPGRQVPGLLAMASGAGALWVGLGDSTLLRLDAASLQAKLSVSMPDRVQAIALSGDAAWTTPLRGDIVRRVDIVTGAVSAGVAVEGTPTAIAYGAGSVWVTTSGSDCVWQVDPNGGRLVGSVHVDISPSDVVVGPDAVWVLDRVQGIVERIDPAGRALPVTMRLGRPAAGMTMVGGDLWLTVR